MDTRLLIVVMLSVVLIFAYQELVLKRLYPPNQNRQAEGSASPGPSPGRQSESGSSAAPAAPELAANSLINAAPAPTREIEVENRLYDAIVTTRGGRLKSLLLKQYRESAAPGSQPYQMVRDRMNGRLPLGLVVASGGNTRTDSELIYTTDAPPKIESNGVEPATIMMTAKTRDGFELQKRITFGDTYALGVEVSFVDGASGVSQAGFSMSRSLVTRGTGFRDIPELQADVQGKALTESEKQLEKASASASGIITYAGFGDRYFLAAYLPIDPREGTLLMTYADDQAHARLLFDHATHLKAAVYFGPKQLNLLESINPALSKAIDFGFLGIIALPLLRALQFFYRLMPNYGVAIILLTIVVRAATLPMSIKGQRSMMRMQRLQPQVERIREKYKNDQERLNREMVDLYKRNHVNPLGGCLPMAIQLPILYGLYEAFLNAFELRQAPFMLWIRDLSAPDCLPIPGVTVPFTDLHGIPVLVILLAATSFLQQWLTPKQPDPNQQKMMMYMPLLFSIIFISLPAGLTLYYLSSNVLGILQQVFLNYEFQQMPPATA